METPSLNLFDFISYLLGNYLSSFELKQNNMAHLNQYLLLNIEKDQQCPIQELNRSFLFDLHQGMVMNEHQYVTKMTLNTKMGGLWGDFTTIFWIAKYLQRSIYIWNKVSKCIMSQCGIDFQYVPLHIAYSSQHFEPIQYVNGLSRSLLTFQVNDFKVTINLDDFPFLSESKMQQPPIQLSQLITCFYWNEKFDYALMDILKK
jgi:hypothetical protein